MDGVMIYFFLSTRIVNFTCRRLAAPASQLDTANNFAVSGIAAAKHFPAERHRIQRRSRKQHAASDERHAPRCRCRPRIQRQRDSYGAEFGSGRRASVIVTQSGTNQWHGTAFEFLRNNVLDAQISSTKEMLHRFGEPVWRFDGGRSGKIIRCVRNYEGSGRACTRLGDLFLTRFSAAAVPSVQPLLNLWPTPPAGAPDLAGSRSFQQPAANDSRRLWTACDHFFARTHSEESTPSTTAKTFTLRARSIAAT